MFQPQFLRHSQHQSQRLLLFLLPRKYQYQIQLHFLHHHQLMSPCLSLLQNRPFPQQRCLLRCPVIYQFQDRRLYQHPSQVMFQFHFHRLYQQHNQLLLQHLDRVILPLFSHYHYLHLSPHMCHLHCPRLSQVQGQALYPVSIQLRNHHHSLPPKPLHMFHHRFRHLNLLLNQLQFQSHLPL